jgi:uncharacterized iron-regulated membrane protein
MLRHPTFHRCVFWLHLITGLMLGLGILSMAVSGLTISFESQITSWADSRHHVSPAPGQKRLPMDELLARVRSHRPDIAPGGITWKSDPAAPVLLNLGREDILYANPYTGEVLGPGDKTWRGLMRTMTEWHRFLGQSGDNRPVGKAITGAATLGFAGLLLSGIYLWWPRHWRIANLGAALLLNSKLRGRARDWNWHNVIGFWSALPLLCIIATGLVMSYDWANGLLFRLAGDTPPPERRMGEGSSRGEGTTRGEAGDRRRSGGLDRPQSPVPANRLTALAARAEQEVPDWKSISLRMQGPNAAFMIDAGTRARPDLRTMLTLDPETAGVISRETFASYTAGKRWRMLARWLHTGELAGLPGQIVAALSTTAALLLVWTGFALAWRRFLGRKAA